MYLLANAIKNLARNKGRNIMLAAITLAIIVSSVVTLTINNAAAKVIDDIRLDLGSRVEIKQDFIELSHSGLISQSNRENIRYVTIDDFYAYADSDYLRNTIFGAEMYAWSGTFIAVGDEAAGAATRTNDDGEEVLVETLRLIGATEPDELPDFGTLREIAEGRMFDGLDECIISEEAAQLNNISIGDVIDVKGAYAYAADKYYSLTVVGIYSDYTEEYTNWFLAMYGRYADSRRNEIIVSFETLIAPGWESNAGLNMTTEYFLKDPDDIRAFENEVRAKGLPVTYDVKINEAAYDKVAGPMSSLRSASVTFMVVILVLGAIVLALLSFMAVRERKYEVGVLRAMGMERGKVAFGFLSEAIMISLLSLAIGLGAGTVMAQPVASSILEGNVAAAEAESEGQGNKAIFVGGQSQIGDGSAGYVPESEIQVSLSANVLFQIIALTLSLAALSGIIGVIAITRYEPLKILRERN